MSLSTKTRETAKQIVVSRIRSNALKRAPSLASWGMAACPHELALVLHGCGLPAQLHESSSTGLRAWLKISGQRCMFSGCMMTTDSQ